MSNITETDHSTGGIVGSAGTYNCKHVLEQKCRLITEYE